MLNMAKLLADDEPQKECPLECALCYVVNSKDGKKCPKSHFLCSDCWNKWEESEPDLEKTCPTCRDPTLADFTVPLLPENEVVGEAFDDFY